MNHFESNYNRPNNEAKKEEIVFFENGNIKYSFENLAESHRQSVKKIIDNIAPYLSNKVEVKFLDFVPHNPGMHSGLSREFKTEEDYDSISINSNFADKTQIPYYLLHELGHAFEPQIEKTAKDEGLEIFAPEEDAQSEYFDDYEYSEFFADSFVGYVMNQDYVKENAKTKKQLNTLAVYEKLFANNNFAEIKKIVNENEANYKAQMIKKYESGEIDKPEWLEDNYIKSPIYVRAFNRDINKEYKNYFTYLEKKYSKD